jgi:uncharacterized SAM-binding protein YcdF (DUF218 family)
MRSMLNLSALGARLHTWSGRRRIVYAIASAAFIFVALMIFEATRIMAVPVNSWTEDQRADCAIVLTGAPGRVREGLDLLAQGAVRKLIISGVHPLSQLREIFPIWPYYGELREEDVILERRSRTTYGNAQQTLPLVEAFHCQRIILVTSRLHMRRATKTFRWVYPADIEILSRATISTQLGPHTDDLVLETVKSIFYNLLFFFGI